mmetsp:Transcript_13808/g.34818  ORF Transcript_13808/g.34818 Transcript_13808/m.34818 type:complete len:225 (+) Transcript_13808:7582-8256(+)
MHRPLPQSTWYPPQSSMLTQTSTPENLPLASQVASYAAGESGALVNANPGLQGTVMVSRYFLEVAPAGNSELAPTVGTPHTTGWQVDGAENIPSPWQVRVKVVAPIALPSKVCPVSQVYTTSSSKVIAAAPCGRDASGAAGGAPQETGWQSRSGDCIPSALQVTVHALEPEAEPSNVWPSLQVKTLVSWKYCTALLEGVARDGARGAPHLFFSQDRAAPDGCKW